MLGSSLVIATTPMELGIDPTHWCVPPVSGILVDGSASRGCHYAF
jgi:hypothetical protein